MKNKLGFMAVALIAAGVAQVDAAVVMTLKLDSKTISQSSSPQQVSLDAFLQISGASATDKLSAYTLVLDLPTVATSPTTSWVASGPHYANRFTGNGINNPAAGAGKFGIAEDATTYVALNDGMGLFTLTVTIPANTAANTYPLHWSFNDLIDADGNSYTAGLSDGAITVSVPEPSTLGLIGVACMLVMRRQRKA